jgi:hypothetical protein
VGLRVKRTAGRKRAARGKMVSLRKRKPAREAGFFAGRRQSSAETGEEFVAEGAGIGRRQKAAVGVSWGAF